MRAQRIVWLGAVTVLGCLLAATSPARDFRDVLEGVAQKATTPAAAVDDREVGAGLKEALANGVSRAIKQLGRQDGFWKNDAVRIPLPKALRKTRSVAERLGQGEKFDAFHRSLNHAAEQAVPQVADIFGNAIRQMTLSDVRDILAGGDHAATDFFRRTAGAALAERIEPIVAKSTDAVGVTHRYKELMASDTVSDALGKLQGLGSHASQDSLDLDHYVTEHTIDGLFHVIAEQEAAIRNNPAARTTDLLKKVFGRGG